MESVDIGQVKQLVPDLIEKTVSGGNDVIITKAGRPIAKISAISKAKKQRKFGTAKGLINIPADFDEPLADFEEYV